MHHSPTRRSVGIRASTWLLLLALSAPASAQPAVETVPGLSRPDPDAVVAEVLARFGGATGAALPTHVDPAEPCLTPLFARIARVASELAPAERETLRALDPHVAVALGAGGAADGDDQAHPADSGLPEEGDLELTHQGKSCVVHYTLTGVHAAPDAKYAASIAKSLDAVVKKTAKGFKRPFFEGARDGQDRLHVYVKDTTTEPGFEEGGALGFVSGVDDVAGEGNEKARTVYMVIDNGITKAEQGKSWKRVLKATVVHEYMHCIQFAYNSYLSSWVLEGMATWAEKRYGQVDDSMAEYWAGPDSIFNTPGDPLWKDTIRQYSTSPLFAYLEQRLGKDALRAYLELSPSSNDGLTVLEDLLIVEELSTLEDFYPTYVGRLAAKDIKGLRKKLIPDFAFEEETVPLEGFSALGSVSKTGVRAYRLERPAIKPFKPDLMFARVSRVPDPGSPESPIGVLVHSRNKRLTLGTDAWNDVEGFRRSQSVQLLVTDADYTFQTSDPTPYRAEFFSPVIRITEVATDSPIPAGGSTEVRFTYDLMFVPGPAFDVALVVESRGPKKHFSQDFLAPAPWATGQARELTLPQEWVGPSDLFGGIPGTFTVTFFARTPSDAYGGEHTRAKAKTRIKAVKAD